MTPSVSAISVSAMDAGRHSRFAASIRHDSTQWQW